MRVVYLALLILTCASCQSSPASSTRSKVTRETTPSNNSIELQVVAVPKEAESPVITNEAVLNCLRSGIELSEPDLMITMTGETTPAGRLALPAAAVGGSVTLNSCLIAALNGVTWPGAGTFRLVIQRDFGGRRMGKGFRLDLRTNPPPVKKFE